LVRLFFVGGLAAALIVLPIDIMSEYFSLQLLTEIIKFYPDFILVTYSLAGVLGFNFLSEFIIAFAVFLLGIFAIHRIIQDFDTHRIKSGSICCVNFGNL
jgi:hypothetical protein